MTKRKGFKFLSGAVLAGSVVLAAVTNGGCSAASGGGLPTGCSGVDAAKGQAQASLKAWVDTVTALDTAATKVEADWLAVCNKINGDLMLDTSKTTAADACAVLNTYIKADLAAGVTINLVVSPPSCQADVSVQGSCEAQCNASASCDVKANCMGGEVVVSCQGTCSAQCDVTQPSFMCNGSCKGECSAMAAVQCMGECSGSCDAPMWTGTCDAGCSATFSGTCGGMCMGMCDGKNSTGSCSGKCVGTCSAMASGSCAAKCSGMFTGGTCMGMCTGKCNVAAGAMCNGTCNGTCSYMPGSAMCSGTCHGMCTGMASPPTCTGQLNCMGSAECHGDCQAQAKASLNCSPAQVQLDIEGDAKLFTSFQGHLADIGAAFNGTLALKDLIPPIASKTAATFSAIGDVGVSGAACVASELTVAAHASASINVSVSASASVSGKSS